MKEKEKEDLWLLDKDFGVLREHGILTDDNIAVIRAPLSGNPDVGPVKMEWVVLCVLTSGTSACTINGKKYALKAHDMVLCLPHAVLAREAHSDDFQMDCLCISRKVLEATADFSMFNWDVMAFLSTHPVVCLNDEEYARFSLYYALMSHKLEHQSLPRYKESMQNLLKSFLFDFYSVVGRYVSVDTYNYSQGQNLFKSFLDLLALTRPKPRAVSFYADKLNITPKYLSAVCKNASGKTASELIHKAVTKEVADLLLYTNKSIKEIMVELDFPSLSFFGKYVKRHFGMGPKELRARRST